MIFDQDNMYLDKTAISGTTNSNVIYNLGGGDPHDPLFLVVAATEALGAEATCALQTSDAEGFSEKTTLATYSLAASTKGILLKAKIPYGMKKYSRLVVSGASSGKLTAGVTATVPNWP